MEVARYGALIDWVILGGAEQRFHFDDRIARRIVRETILGISHLRHCVSLFLCSDTKIAIPNIFFEVNSPLTVHRVLSIEI